MKRIRLIIAYDGAGYAGWQTQPNGTAVQEVLEAELAKLTGARAVLHASGRTDAGVHALAQVAHFDTASRIPPEKFAYALNAGLPGDIRVQYSGLAPEGFHARFDVVKKHYRYHIVNAPHGDAFLRDRALHVHGTLDLPAMRQAARLLLGEHDFAAFKAANSRVKDTRRTLYVSEWRQEGRHLYYDVAGSGFLYNMARILVGTMLRIGLGFDGQESLAAALTGKDRALAGPTAPAKGLTLTRVEYPGFDTADYVEIL